MAFLNKSLELSTKYYYHVSPSKNDISIKTKGLMLKQGVRSSKLRDQGIFLFESLDYLEDALMNWLGDEFDEEESVTIWRVSIPNVDKLRDSIASYEKIYMESIPPAYVRLYKRETL